MSKLLDLKLTKHGERGLSAEILHQDESLRASDEKPATIFEQMGFKIKSVSRPEMMFSTLFLRGSNKDADFISPQNLFSTTEQRDKMHDFILEALEHINKDATEVVRFYECIGTNLWYSEDGLKFYSGLKVIPSSGYARYQKTGRYIDIDIKTDKPVGRVGVEQ